MIWFFFNFATGKYFNISDKIDHKNIKQIFPNKENTALFISKIDSLYKINLENYKIEAYPPFVKYATYSTGEFIFHYGRKGLSSYNYVTLENKLEVAGGRYLHLGSMHFDYNSKENVAVIQNRGVGFSTVKLINTEDLSIIKEFPFKSEFRKTSVSFDPEEPKVYIGTWDGRIICYDTNTGEEIFFMVLTAKGEYLISTPEGYYTSTKNALKRVVFRKDKKIYNFEQFDLLLNRPDKVFKKINKTPSSLLDAYHYAYKKRVKKMGFSPDQLSLNADAPEIKVISELPVETKVKQLKIKLTAKSEKTPLERINIFINNIPILGKRGEKIKKNIFSLNKTYKIKLSEGLNKIQFSAHNTKGLESYMESFKVYYKGEDKKPDLYIISLGVSDFDDDAFDLNYAAKDAEDFANLFSNQTEKYLNIHKFILKNNDVNAERLLEIKKKLYHSNVDDKVILFVASHGLLDEEMNYYIGTSAIDFENPGKNGLPYELLENLLDGIPARNKLMFIDACHSGEIDKEDSYLAEADKTDNAVKVRGFRKIKQKNPLGSKDLYQLMDQLFADLRRGTGSFVIASAGGAEFAYESSDWSNGVFTYSLIRGLKEKLADANRDRKIDLEELQKYVFDNVIKLTNGLQNPTTRQINLEQNFIIWER